MSSADTVYKNIERNFISWAHSAEDIRAAFIVGSRARIDHPADEWSDLDLLFFTSKQNDYLNNNEWLKNFGTLWTSFVSKTAGGDPECLTLYDGGWQVDFVIHSLDNLEHIVKNRIVPKNFNRGVKVIVDKDHVANNIMPQSFMAPTGNALSEEKFIETVHQFWFVALYTAKQILRNELWVAKLRDSNMKECLLQMIEWHEKVINGEDYDTWHAGRFLSEWAGEEIKEELRHSFGHFDESDSWKSLMATISLFKRLSHTIAEKRKFSYPNELENHMNDWLNLQNAKQRDN